MTNIHDDNTDLPQARVLVSPTTMTHSDHGVLVLTFRARNITNEGSEPEYVSIGFDMHQTEDLRAFGQMVEALSEDGSRAMKQARGGESHL